MKFVVRADPDKAGEGTFVTDKATRFTAAETALMLGDAAVAIAV